MEEREMLEKITKSAQQLQVPEALKPEQVKQQLKHRGHKKWNGYKTIAAAACLCLCFGAGGLAYRNERKQIQSAQVQEEQRAKAAGQDVQDAKAPQGSYADADLIQNDAGSLREHPSAEDADRIQEAPVKKLGTMYTLASDYGEVYDVLKKGGSGSRYGSEERKLESAGELEDAAEPVYNSGLASSIADTGKLVQDISKSLETGDKDAAAQEQRDFSTTNLQVEGVDESDIVKTDGSFIYVVQDAKIQVLDVRKAVPAVAGAIEPELDEDTDRICEMYVANQMLTVIIQTEKTQLQQKEGGGGVENVQGEVNVVQGESDAVQNMEDSEAQEEEGMKKTADVDMQYIQTTAVTKVVTYDITNPEKPVLKDTAVQDGWYQTSRKIGSRLYLFTDQSLYLTDALLREEAVKEDSLGLWLPCVNGRVVSADCIYLPKQGSQGLLMASLDLADQNKVLDMKLLVNQYAQLYVSSHSVYLYYEEYANDADRTRIARFALEADGTIRAAAAKTLKGTITDTFAIHEREGYLQVLTSVRNTEPWENRVYVLDENMKTVGKLTGLAKEEQIYSARFVGDIGYFVTYRNTDPLFTVDFSNPKQPKVIGELEVSGFSEYLHFWSDDRLLGLGFETDPDSGETTGVKLSMFDISNPAKVKEEARFVLQGADSCEGLYDYKAVLVNPNKNLIAFTTETYQGNYQEKYQVFAYEDGEFTGKIERILSDGKDLSYKRHWRSVYVGNMLYLVSEKKTIAFAMQATDAEWKEIAKLVYRWKDGRKSRLVLND